MTRKRFVPHTFRRRYNYICIRCGHKRTTLEYERMKSEVCTVCEPKPVDKDQATLFNSEKDNGK